MIKLLIAYYNFSVKSKVSDYSYLDFSKMERYSDYSVMFKKNFPKLKNEYLLKEIFSAVSEQSYIISKNKSYFDHLKKLEQLERDLTEINKKIFDFVKLKKIMIFDFENSTDFKKELEAKYYIEIVDFVTINTLIKSEKLKFQNAIQLLKKEKEKKNNDDDSGLYSSLISVEQAIGYKLGEKINMVYFLETLCFLRKRAEIENLKRLKNG